jgi:hypothetical protein
VHKWIRALTLVLPLSMAFPALASTIMGADGPLAPAADYTLPTRADGLFDFSAIELGAGITLRFDPQMRNVTLLSRGDIRIAGAIDAIGVQLALETPGQIVVTGSISAGSISLAEEAFGTPQLTPGRGGTITISVSGAEPPPGVLWSRGGDISIRAPGGTIFAVPEPSTSWLIALLFPMLAWFGRKRTSGSRTSLLRAC